jgi:hypothetical protein
MFVRQFEDEEEDSAVSALVEKSEAEYEFDGFEIEFSEKIALTPLTPKRGPVAYGQSIARAFRIEPSPDKAGSNPHYGKIYEEQRQRDPRKQITDLAARSAAASVRWSVGNGLEVAPIGYIKGMALVFAKVYCKLDAGDAAAAEMAKASTGNSSTDALALFADEFAAAGMRNDVSGADTLRHLFVLMMSHGMRESGGRYCIGRASTANNNGETAEAGLFQASFNLRSAHATLPQLFDQYKTNRQGLLDVFKEGVPACSAQNLKNVGTGNGQEFQRLSKESPAFAVEFTAVGLRNRCEHWGPVKDKTFGIHREADDMLRQVQDLVKDQKLCPLL